MNWFSIFLIINLNIVKYFFYFNFKIYYEFIMINFANNDQIIFEIETIIAKLENLKSQIKDNENMINHCLETENVKDEQIYVESQKTLSNSKLKNNDNNYYDFYDSKSHPIIRM